MSVSPQPPWAQCHLEIYDAPAIHDDCFRSALWHVFLAAAAESLTPPTNIAGDYAVLSVTEGGVPAGAGFHKDFSALGILTNTFPLARFRLRCGGTTPRYQVGVEYTDATFTRSGWIDPGDTDWHVVMIQNLAGKTVRHIEIYARSNTPNGTANVDYDYAFIIREPPLIPDDHYEFEADLRHTVSVSAFRVKIHQDPLLGVCVRRFNFNESTTYIIGGTKSYDLSPEKSGPGTYVNAAWNAGGKFGSCLFFLAAANARFPTGYSPLIGANDAITIALYVKAAPGVTGVICGAGSTLGGGQWSRIQLNWTADKVRLYVRDDVGNIRQYTTVVDIANNLWHLLVAVVDPANDLIALYVNGVYHGGAAGALGAISINVEDFQIGCLYSGMVYANYMTGYVDEPRFYEKALSADEVKLLNEKDPPFSGAQRAETGDILLAYIGHGSETLVYKIITGRIIDRLLYGDPDKPTVELIGEDMGEIYIERDWTREYASLTQISTIVDNLNDDIAAGIFLHQDTTNRTIKNNFLNENAWAVLQKLAETATFATGETGAHVFVDPGISLRFRKYGAFSSAHVVTDGSDGNPANIKDILVRESIKGDPKLINDAKIIIFEEESRPVDKDSLTESVEGWSSPDPTDMGFPASNAVDFVAGTASIQFNTTNPGTQYRMRLNLPDTDISEMDTFKWEMKYIGVTPATFELRIWRGGWPFVTDYLEQVAIAPAGAGWNEYSVTLSGMGITGNPGATVANVRIRAVHGVQIGVGTFLIDKLRFARTEKYGSSSDAASQTAYGKRTLRVVDKSITNTAFADFLAIDLVDHRKYPVTVIEARVGGRAQLGYRPPQEIVVSSLKDGIRAQTFQIQRARHIILPGSYDCHLELIAMKTSTNTYDPELSPGLVTFGEIIAEHKRRLQKQALNTLRTDFKVE